jgi:hypothetical protein
MEVATRAAATRPRSEVSSSAQTSATASKLRGHSPSDPVMDSPPETLQSDGEWSNDYLKEKGMHAIRFEAFGDASVLKVERLPSPLPMRTRRWCGSWRLRSIRATSRISPEQ